MIPRLSDHLLHNSKIGDRNNGNTQKLAFHSVLSATMIHYSIFGLAAFRLVIRIASVAEQKLTVVSF